MIEKVNMLSPIVLRNIVASRECDVELLTAALIASIYAMKNAKALVTGEYAKDDEILNAAIERAESALKQTQNGILT